MASKDQNDEAKRPDESDREAVTKDAAKRGGKRPDETDREAVTADAAKNDGKRPEEGGKPVRKGGNNSPSTGTIPSTEPALHTAADSTGTLGARQPTAGSQNAGPGTQVTAPPELQTAGTRPPARTITDDKAPIEAPDGALQTAPARGYDTSTTNTFAANAAVSTYPGEDHQALVDEDGNEIDAEDLFDDSDGVQTFVTVKQRAYEVFTYPGATQTATRLLFAAGARVDRITAARIKDAYQLVRNDDGQQSVRVD